MDDSLLVRITAASHEASQDSASNDSSESSLSMSTGHNDDCSVLSDWDRNNDNDDVRSFSSPQSGEAVEQLNDERSFCDTSSTIAQLCEHHGNTNNFTPCHWKAKHS